MRASRRGQRRWNALSTAIVDGSLEPPLRHQPTCVETNVDAHALAALCLDDGHPGAEDDEGPLAHGARLLRTREARHTGKVGGCEACLRAVPASCWSDKSSGHGGAGGCEGRVGRGGAGGSCRCTAQHGRRHKGVRRRGWLHEAGVAWLHKKLRGCTRSSACLQLCAEPLEHGAQQLTLLRGEACGTDSGAWEAVGAIQAGSATDDVGRQAGLQAGKRTGVCKGSRAHRRRERWAS